VTVAVVAHEGERARFLRARRQQHDRNFIDMRMRRGGDRGVLAVEYMDRIALAHANRRLERAPTPRRNDAPNETRRPRGKIALIILVDEQGARIDPNKLRLETLERPRLETGERHRLDLAQAHAAAPLFSG
jgi:hypothetical protein